MMPRIIRSWASREDLTEIWRWIAKDSVLQFGNRGHFRGCNVLLHLKNYGVGRCRQCS